MIGAGLALLLAASPLPYVHDYVVAQGTLPACQNNQQSCVVGSLVSSGAISGTTGTFTGALVATTGTFSGLVSTSVAAGATSGFACTAGEDAYFGKLGGGFGSDDMHLSYAGTPYQTWVYATGQVKFPYSNLYLSAAAAALISANTSDANASATAPAIVVQAANDITAGDLIFGVKDSGGNVVHGITEQGTITLGTTPTFSATAPTITTACTSPTVTHGMATSFQVDVGSSCTGVSAIILGLPTATNGWECHGYNKTAAATRILDQTADSATSATLTNFSRTLGTAADFADGADLVIGCTAR